ncbi:hypothetical protein, partial [Leisingera sp.]|uniref:hypothetical protein n=1 Tax=Leisingera sp. TaxID=1879318 RepID=UPI002B274E3D
MFFRLAGCATAIAMLLPAAARANFLCNDIAAFEICRALHPGSSAFTAINDCIAVEKAACLAYSDLAKKSDGTFTPSETAEVKECSGKSAVGLHWLHQYDCLRNHITDRNQAILANFLTDRN